MLPNRFDYLYPEDPRGASRRFDAQPSLPPSSLTPEQLQGFLLDITGSGHAPFEPHFDAKHIAFYAARVIEGRCEVTRSDPWHIDRARQNCTYGVLAVGYDSIAPYADTDSRWESWLYACCTLLNPD